MGYFQSLLITSNLMYFGSFGRGKNIGLKAGIPCIAVGEFTLQLLAVGTLYM